MSESKIKRTLAFASKAGTIAVFSLKAFWKWYISGFVGHSHKKFYFPRMVRLALTVVILAPTLGIFVSYLASSSSSISSSSSPISSSAPDKDEVKASSSSVSSSTVPSHSSTTDVNSRDDAKPKNKVEAKQILLKVISQSLRTRLNSTASLQAIALADNVCLYVEQHKELTEAKARDQFILDYVSRYGADDKTQLLVLAVTIKGTRVSNYCNF
ncbi:hypothetical protein H6G81_19255 [Scytonema hofmannii FACHB-248]|uniref:Uncharacterized protein n=1 Tax=Scytonema hofmannii FACHB-248 TaxID=1842502 RepID=A0ABR8GU04_9CYAN|nr:MULTISPECIES: hypothetical protein [Nostocales]MBD2606610.1 hypothetical protein [Scytonema hofmannii FACHB-248]